MANQYGEYLLQSLRDSGTRVREQAKVEEAKVEEEKRRLAEGNVMGGISGLLTSLLMGGDIPSNLMSAAKGYVTPTTGNTLKDVMVGGSAGYDTANEYKKNQLAIDKSRLDKLMETQKMNIEKAKTLSELNNTGSVVPYGGFPATKSISLENAHKLPGIVSGQREGYMPINLTEGGQRFIPPEQKSLAESFMTSKENIPSNAMKLDVLGGYYVPEGNEPINEPMPTQSPGENRQWVPVRKSKTIRGRERTVKTWSSEPKSKMPTDKTVLEKISEKDKERAYSGKIALDSVGSLLSQVDSLSKDVSSGIIRNISSRSEWLKNPQVSGFYTDYANLTQKLLKQYQGARSSDKDFQIFAKITGQEAITAQNMKSSLEHLKKAIDRDNTTNLNMLARGYKIPINELKGLFDSGQDNTIKQDYTKDPIYNPNTGKYEVPK